MLVKKMGKYSYIRLLVLIIQILIFSTELLADTRVLYINAENGDDANPGTSAKPLKSIEQAAIILKQTGESGPYRIVLFPGIYSVSQTIDFNTSRKFSDDTRLIIEASILPDDPEWLPNRMPIVVSTEGNKTSDRPKQSTESWTFRINIDHVTIRGLRFMGNPRLENNHGVIERIGKNRDDLIVTQCLFTADPASFDIYDPIIATGDRLVVDHCIFYRCHNAVVFWDGEDGIPGRGHAVRHCIMAGGDVSAVWTCQTSEDLTFRNNVVTDCKYIWMRKPGDQHKYSIENCVLANYEFFSGCGNAFGPFQSISDKVTFTTKNLRKNDAVKLIYSKNNRNYLHVIPETSGSDLQAGLFTCKSSEESKKHNQAIQSNPPSPSVQEGR